VRSIQRLVILGFVAVELGAFPENFFDAASLRAMRVLGRLDLGVVLAMDRHPFLGDHAGREPQPEAEEVTDRRMKIEAPVRLRAVQVNGYGGDGDVREHQRDHEVAPPWQRNEAMGEQGKRIE
jgi:hypothetical protein